MNKRRFITRLLMLSGWIFLPATMAQSGTRGAGVQDFFLTDEAIRCGDQILLYQRVTGGWPKNIDMYRPLSEEEKQQVLLDKKRRNDSTTDNGATNPQIRFLANLYQKTGDRRYRDGFRKGVDYLLSGQYKNGGWPQFWPEMRDYQPHITYNDGAMVNTMNLLREVSRREGAFGGDLVGKARAKKAAKAFDKGVKCMLKTQIIKDGKPSVWCQQHDRVTLLPAKARAYELPSYCSAESAGIVRLLMSIENPGPEIRQAVHGAMQWFDTYKITGYRYVRNKHGEQPDARLVPDSTAGPLWGRFYDLKYCEPYVCDRDSQPKRSLEEIGLERRTGYSWYNANPAELYWIYGRWADRYCPDEKLPLDVNSPGGNELGIFRMDRSEF